MARILFHSVAVLELLGAPVAAAGSNAEPIDIGAIQALLGELNCPGAVVAIVPATGAARTYAIGHADSEKATPMTVDLHLRIGSVSKLLVGSVVLRAVDRGLLSLDDPISKYVAGVPKGDQITIRMLGRHTSGLFDPIYSVDFRTAVAESPTRLWRPKEVLEVCFRSSAKSAPGAQTRYANIGAILLGEAVANAAKKPFPEVLRDTVLQPQGLKDTGYCRSAGPPQPTASAYRFAAESRWLGYGDHFTDVTGFSASWSSWAGDMYSTIDDLAKAARPLITGELLSASSRRELLAWRKDASSETDYGFLIKKTDLGVGHDGDVPGFSAAIWCSEEGQRTYVAIANLSNAADGRNPANEIVRLMATEGAH